MSEEKNNQPLVNQSADTSLEDDATKEYGGPKGEEPTRYGDWERNGLCKDF
tara:strand:+ start:1428 stop:1580 length:153 start_codon:yes stop_codon:yes gene_type:complete